MSQLALASLNATGPSARWAHDIRNALATVGLHLETLERLSGTRGREIAYAAHMLMTRAAAMCNEAMAQESQTGTRSHRKPFDIAETIVQVANLLRPAAPDGFEIRAAGNGAFTVLADPQDAFRILFNLVHNAMTIARQRQDKRDRMTNVTLLIERSDATVKVRIADDGPGLPVAVRTRLFRRQKSATGGGIGLSIARELAEQNGGVLELAESARGTTFVLELPASTAVAHLELGAHRSLGKRIQH